MDPRQAKLEQLHRWKQVANWSTVLWLPLGVYGMLTGRAAEAMGVAIAGLVFFAVARVVVVSSRCPGCETRFRDTPAGIRRVWNEIACEACGLSLFELRRARARD